MMLGNHFTWQSALFFFMVTEKLNDELTSLPAHLATFSQPKSADYLLFTSVLYATSNDACLLLDQQRLFYKIHITKQVQEVWVFFVVTIRITQSTNMKTLLSFILWLLTCAEGKLRIATRLVSAAVVILTGTLLYIDLLVIPSRADVRVVCACAVPGCRYHVAAGQTQWLTLSEKAKGISHLTAGHDTTGTALPLYQSEQYVLM